MQFSTIISALLVSAVAVSAAPASSATTAMQSVNDSATAALKQLQASGCNELKCIASLAGSTAACGAAAAELGANPLADIGCFASVGSNIAGDVCAGCF